MPKSYYPGDRFEQMRHRSFTRSKCQAKFRNEEWALTLEEWRLFWTPERWRQRGKGTMDLCMTRIDPEKSWSRSNCCLVTRVDQLQMKAKLKRGVDVSEHREREITI